jgi:hypothetical protein
MRAVTLSDRKVRNQLNKKFVCTWGNVEGDPTAGASFAHQPSDPPGSCIRGNGEHNMQVLVLTPDGELLNALAGYLSPDELRQELDLALEIYEGLVALERELPQADPDQARVDVVESAHRRFLQAYEQGDEREDEGVFADFIAKRVASDHRFSMENALADARDFDPVRMVGNAQTFFGGYQGGKPSGEIGKRKRKR